MTTRLKRFLQLESSSSIVLLMMAIIAMLWANSPLAFLHTRFVETFLFVINEGLMAFFFLLVGLELKRGLLEGELANPAQALLPAIAAIGGMLLPALIYLAFNYSHPVAIQGWATPVATDIAFALGVLALFNHRLPTGLKLFLLALAIFDDIGAIVIITLFYSHGLSYAWLFQSIVLLGILYALNQLGVRKVSLYCLLGVGLWFGLLRAGIHPAITGVLLAFAIPDEGRASTLRSLENRLHPWVAFCIMPLFALANAGVSLQTLTWHHLTDSVVLGIVLGLFIGKQVGVFAFSWLVIRLGLAKLPAKSTWFDLYGVAVLCGIGFTMSLFLGTLSFQQQGVYLAEVRISVIIGSLLSGLVGAGILALCVARRRKVSVEESHR